MLPAHVPAVRVADIHRLMMQSPPELRRRFYDLWRDIFDTPFPEKPQERRFCELTQPDIEVLEARGVIEKAPPHLEPNTSMFRIDEPEKQRARIITWTQRVNDIRYEASPALNITDPYKVILLADGTHSAVVADLKAAFYQIEIPTYARHRFVFRYRDTVYQFTRLPMGARQSAELCAIYLQCLTIQALSRCGKLDALGRAVFHVDNVRIPATPDTGGMIRDALVAAAADFGATWGECEWSRSYTFLGFNYDHEAQTIAIKDSKRRKLADTLMRISPTWPASVKDWLKAMGRATTYARALGLPPTAFARMLAMQRRVQATKCPVLVGNLEDRLHLALLHATILNSRTLAFSLFRGREGPLHLYTDASLDGYAAVLCTKVNCQVLAKRRSHTSINQAELFALEQGLRFFFHQLRAARVVVHMDSQVALRCIGKRHSPVFVLQNLVQRIWSVIERIRPLSIEFEKIPSKLNPADAPSRNRPIDTELPSTLGRQQIPLDATGEWCEYDMSDSGED